MASIQFTEADRDERGFVNVPSPEPRSLADLLPPIAPPARQTIQRHPPTRAETIALIVLSVLLAALLAYLWSSAPAHIAAPPRSAAATSLPLAPSAAPTPIPAGRLLVAFAAPGGDPLGAIESTRAITPTAHYGSAWIQADVAGSGRIWLRASDAPELAIVGPDLAPRPTATALPYVPAIEPPPPPAPTQCAEVGISGKMVSSCGLDDLSVLQDQAKAKWIETYGGNIGTVSTPSPQVR